MSIAICHYMLYNRETSISISTEKLSKQKEMEKRRK